MVGGRAGMRHNLDVTITRAGEEARREPPGPPRACHDVRPQRLRECFDETEQVNGVVFSYSRTGRVLGGQAGPANIVARLLLAYTPATGLPVPPARDSARAIAEPRPGLNQQVRGLLLLGHFGV
jgi:hypothetical protein